MPRSRKPIGEMGQTSVETALVLPVLGLLVFGLVWLMCFCRNSVQLQKVALDRIRAITANPRAFSLSDEQLWGHSSPLLPTRSSERAQPWRPAKPVLFATVHQTPGTFIRLDYQSLLTGGTGFTRRFLPRGQQVQVQTFLESVPVTGS